MLSLKQPLDDKIRINGRDYFLDLSFDNVLRWYELIDDDSINEMGKILLAFEMFIPECEVDVDTQIKAIQAISKYIAGEPNDGQETSDQTQYYSFSKDAEYIYASFLQEYGIDLIDQQGVMRWEKFIALFKGLRDNTKINQIIGIRATDVPNGSSEYEKAERERILQLKSAYALDSEQNRQEQETRMDHMFDTLVNMARKGG
ncbi:Gp15 family bacteriophage protein [Sporolactobacillus pectinivorans]|uniref:Gp15 family bacteriophage protein n=1 Tax=Sporolactobacillus pectinivorans TaxID=1591408 RepID=UPI000C25B576|nr:Gp15 family bacteriophage protein [Sporolactobacillus pectinivorans]